MAINPNSLGKTLRDLDDRQTKLFSTLDGEEDLGVVLMRTCEQRPSSYRS